MLNLCFYCQEIRELLITGTLKEAMYRYNILGVFIKTVASILYHNELSMWTDVCNTRLYYFLPQCVLASHV
jgi:hypothetical protein